MALELEIDEIGCCTRKKEDARDDAIIKKDAQPMGGDVLERESVFLTSRSPFEDGAKDYEDERYVWKIGMPGGMVGEEVEEEEERVVDVVGTEKNPPQETEKEGGENLECFAQGGESAMERHYVLVFAIFTQKDER